LISPNTNPRPIVSGRAGRFSPRALGYFLIMIKNSFSLVLLFFAIISLSGCGNGSGGGSVSPTSGSSSSVPNQMQITVGSQSGCSDVDEPCGSVTICTPGTTFCQTIGGILIDTGSYGLRIFSNLVTVSLPAISNGNPLAECAYFGSGTSFGPVVSADVILAGEPAVTVPVQEIESSYSGQTSSSNVCGSATYTSSSGASFNGILGIGLLTHDCGSFCVSDASNGEYFSCNGSTCSGSTASLSNQVQNPVTSLPSDNNGVEISFPAVSGSGTSSANGTLSFGIGTQTDNTPGPVQVFEANLSANFTTIYAGTSYSGSFLDTGSNGFFFPGSSSTYPSCTSNPGFFCPSSPVNDSATNQGLNGSTGSVSFTIGNADILLASSNYALPTLGGDNTSGFDWGLPFFFGRSVFIGINGQNSSLGLGPYWAY